MLKYFLIIICTASIGVCQAQYISRYTLSVKRSADTLTDRSIATKFILDTSRIFITAVDSNGKQLWKIDPWKDNKFEAYRVKRPLVASFHFANNEQTENKEVLWIVYNNTQFGIVDKKTGKFKWFGQD